MQVEIKVILFNPGVNPECFCADVYLDGTRVHCGMAGSRVEALQEAGAYIAKMPCT